MIVTKSLIFSQVSSILPHSLSCLCRIFILSHVITMSDVKIFHFTNCVVCEVCRAHGEYQDFVVILLHFKVDYYCLLFIMRPARISVHGATKCQHLPAYLRSKDSNRTVTNYLIPVSAVWKGTDGGIQQLLSKSRKLLACSTILSLYLVLFL